MTATLRTAFGALWDQRQTHSAQTHDSATCDIDTPPAHPSTTQTGTPRSRSFGLRLLQEDLRWFRARHGDCQPPAAADQTEEQSLGDGAFSCSSTYDHGPYLYVSRRLHLRVDAFSFLLALVGSNQGSQAVEDIALLRTDIQERTRCIAEALAKGFNRTVIETATCAGTATNL